MAIEKENQAAALKLGINNSIVRRWRLQQGDLARSVSDDAAAGTMTQHAPNLSDNEAEVIEPQNGAGGFFKI